MEDNAASLRLVRDASNPADTAEVDLIAVAAEEELITAESSAILDRALEAGDDDVGESVVRAVSLGILDLGYKRQIASSGGSGGCYDAVRAAAGPRAAWFAPHGLR